MSEKLVLLTELGVAASLIVVIVASGRIVRKRHYWQADSLYEIAAEVGYMTFWGMLLTHFFSFNGSDAFYTAASSALFMTFLLPFLSLTWVGDWPSQWARSWSDRNRCNAWPGFIAFGISMAFLGGGAYFACLNSAQAASAPYWGLGIGCGAFAALLLMAAFSEGFFARA
jgi:hypothetical protein